MRAIAISVLILSIIGACEFSKPPPPMSGEVTGWWNEAVVFVDNPERFPMPHALFPHVRISAHLTNTSTDTAVVYLGGKAVYGIITAPDPDELGRFALVVGDTQLVMHGYGPGETAVLVLAPGDTSSVELFSDNRSFLPPSPPPPPPGTDLGTYEAPDVPPSVPVDSAGVADEFVAALLNGRLRYFPNPGGKVSFLAFDGLGFPFWCQVSSSGWLVADTLSITRQDAVTIHAADNLGTMRPIMLQP